MRFKRLTEGCTQIPAVVQVSSGSGEAASSSLSSLPSGSVSPLSGGGSSGSVAGAAGLQVLLAFFLKFPSV